MPVQVVDTWVLQVCSTWANSTLKGCLPAPNSKTYRNVLNIIGNIIFHKITEFRLVSIVADTIQLCVWDGHACTLMLLFTTLQVVTICKRMVSISYLTAHPVS